MGPIPSLLLKAFRNESNFKMTYLFQNCAKCRIESVFVNAVVNTELSKCFDQFCWSFWIFFVYWHKSVPFSLDLTLVENFSLKIKHLEQEVRVISTEHVEKSCAKVLVIYFDRIHFEASQWVTMPNGSSHSLDGTSNEVLQKRSTSLCWYFLHKRTYSLSERRLLS